MSCAILKPLKEASLEVSLKMKNQDMLMMGMNPAVEIGHKLARDLRGSEQTLTNNVATTTYLIIRNNIEGVPIHEPVVQPYLPSIILLIVDEFILTSGRVGSKGSSRRHSRKGRVQGDKGKIGTTFPLHYIPPNNPQPC